MASQISSAVFEEASLRFDGRRILADTGRVGRVWELVPGGLATRSFTLAGTDRNAVDPDNSKCDWELPGLTGRSELRAVKLSRHEKDYKNPGRLSATAEFCYPQNALLVRYQIDCYPGAPGFRTRLWIKSLVPVNPALLPEWPVGAYTERFAFPVEQSERIGFGYYCDTQHRYHHDLPILKEERRRGPIARAEVFDFANGMLLQGPEGGIALVKESHKCVNNSGVDTGEFILHATELLVTGLGLAAVYEGCWIDDQEFRGCWSNWSILYQGDEAAGRRAVKEFDRARFPFRMERDMWICSNTWGSRGAGSLARAAAEQGNILREIDSAADIGVELVQIDDGWQFDPGGEDFFHCDWLPSKVRFPDGWTRVKEYAEQKNIRLGLWFPWFAPIDKMIQNRRAGGFRRFKLDFSELAKRKELDKMIAQADAVVKEGHPEMGLNWDITENVARIGFFFAREYGNIFLQNNEVSAHGGRFLHHVHYSPEITLGKIWQLAKYLNLNQFQLSIQRNSESDRADGYSQDYAFATAMFGLPLFFLETQHFSEEERKLLRPLVRLYKENRARILNGYTEPVGEQPDGKSYTGFLCRCPDGGGVLAVFREKSCMEPEGVISDLPDRRYELLHGPGQCRIFTGADGIRRIGGLSRSSFAIFQYS